MIDVFLTDIYTLAAGIYAVETWNEYEGQYEYYLFKPGRPLVPLMGLLPPERFSETQLQRLYEHGHFDNLIQKNFTEGG